MLIFNTKTAIIIGALILTVAGSATGIALSRSADRTSIQQSKGTSASVPNPSSDDTGKTASTTDSTVGQTRLPGADTNQKPEPVPLPQPGTQPASRSTNSSASYPIAPPLKGYTPPAAFTEPGSFLINIEAHTAHIDGHGQVVATFTILRTGGYSLPMSMPETEIIQTPPGATGITCGAGFKETDQGVIALYGPDDAPSGTYGCKLIITSGGFTQSAIMYFEY